MILAMVGYLTFYFDIENFTDRVMVVLTTLLVIATITQTINQVHINLTGYLPMSQKVSETRNRQFS